MVQRESALLRIKDRKELIVYADGLVLDVGVKDAYPWGRVKDGYLSCDLPENVIGLDLDIWKHKNFVQGDARCLPFRDKVFNVVILMELLEHVKPDDRMSVISEVLRVCSKRVIISVPDRDPRNLMPDPNWCFRHPKFRKALTTPELHEHKLEWMFDLEGLLRMVGLMKPRDYRLFRIENEYYSGYGAVVDL